METARLLLRCFCSFDCPEGVLKALGKRSHSSQARQHIYIDGLGNHLPENLIRVSDSLFVFEGNVNERPIV